MKRKIGFFEDNNTEDFERFETIVNSNIYHIQNSDHFSRIIVWSVDVIDTLLSFVRIMKEPYFLLYILNVSRTGQETARYQSNEIDFLELERFFIEFGDFIKNDSRHDIWIHSPGSNSTIVYDKDNLIYLYGDIKRFQELLITKQFLKQIESIYLPIPHTHLYHQEFDQQEVDILQYLKWHITPLREEDY
ncbi:hypothetical protein PCCS19_02240 [Paenibacillus sp. CCS19]|nr:hypothetical protein PCCS19_02240 [Paenibacillus cellulosilyticus]